jgi:hypothetical protein
MDLILVYILIGLATGFFTGMFGIGGGSVRVPLLAMTGMPLINAFATNMFAIPFTSTMGAFVHRKNIRWDIVKIFTFGGVLGIIVATFIVGIVSNQILALMFFFAAIITVLGLYLDKLNYKLYDSIRATPINLFISSFLGNLIIGARGGSGGTLFPPMLKAMNIEMPQAIATSLFAGIFSSLFALSIYFLRDEIIFIPAIIVAITGIIGSYFGSKTSMKTKPEILKIGLAIVVLVLALSVVYKELF